MSIDITNVTKRFGDFVALDNVNVSIPTGQLTALLGPSGGGKSTLLRIIAGLDSADDDPQQGGLAATGRAEERGQLTGRDADVDVVQGDEVAELLGDTCDVDAHDCSLTLRSWVGAAPRSRGRRC